MGKNKKRTSRAQMMAVAALMTSAIAPYAVSADTVTTTSTEVTTTTTATTTYVEKAVDYTVTTSMDGLDARLKSAMVGDVNLRVDSDGKKYAQIAFINTSYGFESFSNKNKEEITPISTSGEAGTATLVRVIEVPLDEKYQAEFSANAPRFGGELTFNFDLATEAFDFDFKSSNNSYFTSWVPSADVVTLKDGKKVAYIHLGGHSYGVETVFEGTDQTKEAQVIVSNGTFNKDLTRTVRVELGSDLTTNLTLPMDEKGVYTFGFDFNEKAQEVKFVTATNLTAEAKALEVEFKSTDAAQFWLANIVKAGLTNPTAKAVNGKIEVTFDAATAKTLTVTQNGTDVPVTLQNGKATFTVANLEGLTLDGVFEVTNPSTQALTESKASVTLEKAVTAALENPEAPTTTTPEANEGEEAPTTITTIPATVVAGKTTTTSFVASSSNDYFQKGGFFSNNVTIAEIDGKTYADIAIEDKSFDMDFNYTLTNGTVGDALEIAGNRADYSETNYTGFKATIRVPVTVEEDGSFTFKLTGIGSQPGQSALNVQLTFTGKINKTQGNVAVKYTDIKDEATKAYVQQLANWGALNTSLNKFNPSSHLTRGQFALMITRALELEATGKNQFKDIKDAEVQNAVQALFEAGVVSGYEKNTKFKPNDKITRTQAALMIQRLLTKQLKYTSTATADDANFNDFTDIKSDEAKLAFGVLKKAGVMTGSNGFINPNSKLTRAQMSKILVESLKVANFSK